MRTGRLAADVGAVHPRTHAEAAAPTAADSPTGQWFSYDEWGDDPTRVVKAWQGDTWIASDVW